MGERQSVALVQGLSGLGAQACCALAVRPWVSHSTSLSLSPTQVSGLHNRFAPRVKETVQAECQSTVPGACWCVMNDGVRQGQAGVEPVSLPSAGPGHGKQGPRKKL